LPSHQAGHVDTRNISKIDQRQQQPHHDQHYYDTYKSHWKTS
jgi:hypothetical protein